ncbi:hypothetical protein B5M45_05420, partial [Mycobacterium simiae]
MESTWNLSKGLAAVVVASAAAFGLSPNAAADPAAPLPTPPQPDSAQQLPGLPALSQLSPIIQQAAGNPGQATQLLMAAAQAFTHNPSAPTESKNVAASVNQFVQEPGAPLPGAAAPAPQAAPTEHVPGAGIVPGAEAHLPTGIDPAHAAGPAPAAAPPAGTPHAPAPGAAPGPAPVAAPAAAPAPEA